MAGEAHDDALEVEEVGGSGPERWWLRGRSGLAAAAAGAGASPTVSGSVQFRFHSSFISVIFYFCMFIILQDFLVKPKIWPRWTLGAVYLGEMSNFYFWT